MRLHYDPRLTTAREGQIELETGPFARLIDGTARSHRHPFRPYQWRDPARARDWARLPADLIELMKTEEVEPLPIRHPIIVRKSAMTDEPQDRDWEIQYADSDVMDHVHAHRYIPSIDGCFIEFRDSQNRLAMAVRTDLVRSIRVDK